MLFTKLFLPLTRERKKTRWGQVMTMEPAKMKLTSTYEYTFVNSLIFELNSNSIIELTLCEFGFVFTCLP